MVRVHVAAMASGTDAAANRAAAVEAVRAAGADGAGLLVLPEYAAAFDPSGVGAELAEPLDGAFVTALREEAAAAQLTVVAGTAIPGADGRLAVNAVVVVAPDGSLAGVYRKVHLYDAFGHRESDRLEPGSPDAAPVVVEVGGVHVGVMTCYDLRFPESARRLVDSGADVLAVPAAWAAGEHKADHWLTLLRARAIENTAYVLGAAQQGRGVTGSTVVVDPLGVVMAEVPPPSVGDRPAAGPAVGRTAGASSGAPVAATADVDPEHLAAVRARNPSLVNRRYVVVPR